MPMCIEIDFKVSMEDFFTMKILSFNNIFKIFKISLVKNLDPSWVESVLKISVHWSLIRQSWFLESSVKAVYIFS